MANALSANVWRIDTTGSISGAQNICGIKLIGGSNAATLSITKQGGSTVIYQSGASTNSETYDAEVEIKSAVGLTVTITGTGAVAYLYRE